MSSGFVTISDKGEKYINITTPTYSVDVPKNNIIIQKNSDDSFFIKHGTYIKYFKKSDILRPMLPNGEEKVDFIVEKIKSFASEDQFDLSLINKSDMIYEVSVQYDLNDRQFSSYIDYNTDEDLHESINEKQLPDSAWDNISRTVKLHVAEGSNNMLVSRQSKEYIRIPFGNTLAGLISARLIDSDDTNVVSRVGFFDNEKYVYESSDYISGQGVYIGYDGEAQSNKMFIGLRSISNSNDQIIYSDEWNVDPMDGSPGSVSGEILRPTDMNTFIFIFGNINGASMKIGLYKHGKLNIFHDMNSDDLFDYDCSLPIRMEIETLEGYTGSHYLEHKNASVYSVEKQIDKPLVVSYKHSVNTSDQSWLDGENTIHGLDYEHEMVVASLRLNKHYIRSKLKITKLEIQSSDSLSSCEWILAINPHWDNACSDTYNYISKDDNVYMNHSIAAFGLGSFTGGQFLDSSSNNRDQDYILAYGKCTDINTVVDLTNNNHYLLADMHAYPDVARVFLTNEIPVDPGIVTCTLTWEEYI